MPHVILGIDPASTKIALVLRQPITGTFTTAKFVLGEKASPQTLGNALESMLTFLRGIDSMCSNLDRIAYIESPLVGRGGIRTTMVQSFTSGVVQACLIQGGWEVHLVNVSTWKSRVCGKGNATKREVGQALAGLWPKAHRSCAGDQDLIDAACIALYADQVATKAGLVGVRSVPRDGDGDPLREPRLHPEVRRTRRVRRRP